MSLSRLVIAAAAASASLQLVPTAAVAARPIAFQQRLERQFTAAGGVGSGIAVDLKTGSVIWQHLPDTALIPASVNKLFTTASFLLALGPRYRLGTQALGPLVPIPAPADGGTSPGDGPGIVDPSGQLRGNLVLKGGGDPSLGPTGITAIARDVRSAGVLSIPGRVLGDDGLFDRIRGVPAWGGVDSDQGGLLSALAYDHEGSAKGAATALTLALRRVGVKVPKGHTGVGTAPEGASVVATHASPMVSTLIRWTNQPSDNFFAEMLTKALGAIKARSGTTKAGLAAADAELAKLGVRATRVDGSGLSRGNRATARMVERLLAALSTNRYFVSSLAVAGRSGTIADRMRGTAAAGRCRAKTGTLSNVSALAGYCDTTGGRRVAFALLMNRVAVWKAHKRQDAIASALVGWRPSP